MTRHSMGRALGTISLALCLLPQSATVNAAGQSDAWLAYRYGEQFTEPARPNDITKHILTGNYLLDHATGKHFLSLEGRFSDANDPAKNSQHGASEYLFNYRYQLAAGKLLDAPLAFGPVRDIALLGGIDQTTKNTLFAPRKQAWMAGPVIKLAVPGMLDIGLLYYKERNHKGIPGTPRPDTTFEGTWLLNAQWAIPMRFGGQEAVFQGLFNRLGSKGSDFNYGPTAQETLLRTAILFDLSPQVGLPRQKLMLGLGYEWWKNKYGTPAGIGTFTHTPTLNLETHF